MNKSENIDQLVRLWLADLDTSENTVRQYKMTVMIWFRFLAAKKINSLNAVRSNVISYRNELVREGKSPFTVNNYLASLHSFYTWVENNGKGENIAAGIKTPIRYKQHRRDHLSEDQVQRLLSFDQSGPEGLRDYLIIAFMLVFGLRRSEVWGINDQDIKFKPESGEYVLFIKRKGHTEKEPVSNVPPNILEVIRDYQRIRGANDFPQLFQDHRHRKNLGLSAKTISSVINKRLREAGLKSKTITPHSLRHTAAVRAIRNGATVYEVQKMLGHTSPETTRPYFMSLEAEKYMSNPVVYAADKSLIKPLRIEKKDIPDEPLKGDRALNRGFSTKVGTGKTYGLKASGRGK